MPLVLSLAVASFIPVMVAAVRVIQIPAGGLPDDSLRLAVAPVAHWLHSGSAILFGVLGPLQFARALRSRFGVVHRISGRVFVLAGLVMGASGLALLWRVESIDTPLLDYGRAGLGAALIAVLLLGLRAARAGRREAHRSGMIRAYAIGMGGATVALVMFPIYLVTGAPVTGLASDLVFLGWWLCMIGLGEAVIGFLRRKEGAA